MKGWAEGLWANERRKKSGLLFLMLKKHRVKKKSLKKLNVTKKDTFEC